MAQQKPVLEIPGEGIAAFLLLIDLGKQGIDRLRQGLKATGPSLAPIEIRAAQIAETASGTPPVADVELILAHGVAPLVSIINQFDLSPEEVHAIIAEEIDRSADPDVWSEEHTKKWIDLRDAIVSLLSLDVLEIETKAGSLLAQRANWVTSLRVISEVRPVFDDPATAIKATLLVNTLVLRFQDGRSVRTEYFSLDPVDLDVLEDQIKRAKRKNELISEKYGNGQTKMLMWATHDDHASEG